MLLSNRRSPGKPPRLSAEQKAELAALVEAGPDPEIDGVVRWRRIDLKRWIAAQFGVVMHERTGGRAVGGRRDVAVVRTDDLFARAVAPFVGKTIHRIAFCSSSPHAILVLDGAGWHASKDLVAPDNVTPLTLPPYAPELNPVENVWQYLRSNKLAITVFDGYADIVDKYCNAWNFVRKRYSRHHHTTMGTGQSLGTRVSERHFGKFF